MSELSVATVVCTATRERADLLRACVKSLVAGTRIPDELFVVVDQNPPLLAELEDSLPAPVRLLHTERQGLSEARNVGLRAAAADVVAFVDDDATVDPDWLACLTRVFEADDRVLGAGGAALPRWGADRRWLPDELLWIVGCTYRGHREDAGPIRNPLGCNMAFRRRELVGAGAFAAGFGKRGAALETCDETELSLRIERGHGHGRIRYVPEARVRHFVPAERISWRLLLRRSVSEGLSKGRLHALYRGAALGPERAYTRRLLLDVVPRLLAGGVLRRDGRSARGGLAVLLSLAVTSVAFCVGAIAARRTAARDKGRRRW
jgi:glycosyltransferase involved in cell wall biosynthesis